MNKPLAYATEFAAAAAAPRAAQAVKAAAPMTLAGAIASLFSVSLREKLDADTRGDRADAAYHWGM